LVSSGGERDAALVACKVRAKNKSICTLRTPKA
jgi:hypothetical protein